MNISTAELLFLRYVVSEYKENMELMAKGSAPGHQIRWMITQCDQFLAATEQVANTFETI